MKANLPYNHIVTVKNGKHYVIFDYKDENNKRKRKWVTTGLPENCAKKALKAKVEEIVAAFHEAYYSEKAIAGSEANTAEEALKIVLGNNKVYEFTEYHTYWLESTKPSISYNTYIGYMHNLNKVRQYFDEKYPHIKLSEVKALHLQQYYNWMYESGLSGNTVRHHHVVLHKAFKYAIKIDILDANPTEKTELPKIKKFEASFYSKEELDKLFEVFKGDRLELVVHIAAYYGLRRSEVLGLRWDAVDFKNKTITIQRKVVSDYDENGQRKLYVETRLKTNSTRRTLPLIPHIERMLLEKKELEAHFKKICGSSYDKEFEGFICRDNYGKLISPEYVTSRFHYVITKAGLRHLRFHDLRHSCASLLLANDVPMKAIQEWLGHSNYAITANLYSHLEYNAKVISAETIARVLDGEADQHSKAPAETAKPEKQSTKKKTTSKKTASKTTDTPAPKKTGGRKKKSDTPAVTGESQSSRL